MARSSTVVALGGLSLAMAAVVVSEGRVPTGWGIYYNMLVPHCATRNNDDESNKNIMGGGGGTGGILLMLMMDREPGTGGIL